MMLHRLLPSAALLSLSLACAHAPTAAAPPEQRPGPQLSTKAEKAAPGAPAALASGQVALAGGQAALDDALARLSGVSVFFEFDQATLTLDAEEKLAAVGDVLRRHPLLSVRVEGNCDERGTDGYNLALGQHRADVARSYLLRMGAAPNQVSAISLGSERPRAAGHEESAWSQNRRDDVTAQGVERR